MTSIPFIFFSVAYPYSSPPNLISPSKIKGHSVLVEAHTKLFEFANQQASRIENHVQQFANYEDGVKALLKI